MSMAEARRTFSQFDWERAYYAVHTTGAMVGVGILTNLLYRNRFKCALKLFLKRHKCSPLSQRAADVESIQDWLAEIKPHETGSFMVVVGPKGVGKTTAVHTALLGMRGVVHVPLAGGLNSDQIQERVFNLIWPHSKWSSLLTAEPKVMATKVVKAYRPFGRITVLLDIAGLPEGAALSDVGVAARELANRDLRVLVDTSESSTHGDTIFDPRAHVVRLDYMDWKTVQSIPQFKDTLHVIEELQLLDLVKSIVGGSPAKLKQLELLRRMHARRHGNLTGFSKDVKNFLITELFIAVQRREALLAKDTAWQAVLQEFVDKDKLPVDCVKKLQLPELSRVLRVHRACYVPATPAMAVVLKNKLRVTDAEDKVLNGEIRLP